MMRNPTTVSHGKPQLTVLVGVREPGVVTHLREHLDGDEFILQDVKLDSRFMDRVLADVPDIVILDLLEGDERTGLNVTVLKRLYPNTRIIVLSPKPSLEDGSVLEKGIFYYLSGPWQETLVDIVKAARRSLAQCAKGRRDEP